MLTLLPTNQIEHIHALLEGLSIHLVSRSILAGSTPAQVYVDDPQQPSMALVKAGHRILLCGSPSASPALTADLKSCFESEIYPEFVANHVEGFGVYYAPTAWADLLAQIFTDRQTYHTRREYYAGLPESGSWRASLPEGFSLRPVDAALLADPQISGLDDLREEMCSERPSVPDFLARSFGLAAIYDNRLAGWCLSEYNSENECEIGIASLPPYRQCGLAVSMTRAFAEMALQRGIRRIGWHCWASNTPSGATARKAGLSKICDYQAYVVILGSV